MLLTPPAVAAAAAETAAVAADTAAAVADTAAAVAAVVAEFGAVALVSDVGAQEGSLPGLGPRPRPGQFAPLCVVDSWCWPAGRACGGKLPGAAARWPYCRDAAWVAILNLIVPLLARSLRPTRVT